MKKSSKTATRVIDLGSVTRETQGPLGTMIEHTGFWTKSGISVD